MCGHLQGICWSDAHGTSGVAASQSSCQIQFNLRGAVGRPVHPLRMLSSQYKGCHGCTGAVSTMIVGEVNTMQGQRGDMSGKKT